MENLKFDDVGSDEEKKEFYTDKEDRAATVLFGSKAIKESLKDDKKQQTGQRIEPEVKLSHLYLMQGLQEMKRGSHTIALKMFTRALQLTPDDKICLTFRSKCNLQLGDNVKALRDVEEAMRTDPNYVDAIRQKAETLYLMGDFEHALVYFQRGFKFRSGSNEFRMGIQKCHEAINNAIGVFAPFDVTSRELTEAGATKAKKAKSRSTVTAFSDEASQVQVHVPDKRNKFNEYVSKTLLGKVYMDKVYLNTLLACKELATNKSSDRRVREIARNGLSYLHTREEFWRKQQPIYSRKLRGKLQYVGGKKSVEEVNVKMKKLELRRDLRGELIQLLTDIDNALNAEHYHSCLQWCEQILKKLNTYYGRKLQNRNEILASVFSQMGSAYLGLGNYSSAVRCYQRDLNIATENDFKEEMSAAMENLGKAYAESKHYHKAVEIWKKKIPLCQDKTEKAWLYHEIGRAYLELGYYLKAIEYGEQGIKFAIDCLDIGWNLNCTALIAQAHVFSGNIEEGINCFKKALTQAKVMENNVAIEALRQVLWLLEKHKVEESVTVDKPDRRKRSQSMVVIQFSHRFQPSVSLQSERKSQSYEVLPQITTDSEKNT